MNLLAGCKEQRKSSQRALTVIAKQKIANCAPTFHISAAENAKSKVFPHLSDSLLKRFHYERLFSDFIRLLRRKKNVNFGMTVAHPIWLQNFVRSRVITKTEALETYEEKKLLSVGPSMYYWNSNVT